MDNKVYTINGEESIGTVQIADDVVAVIAGLAATEVEGVSSMAGNISNDIMNKMGYKSLTKGVKTDIVDGKVKIEMSLTMSYGYNIPATCSKVQEKIKTTIENMTGLEVTDVNIRIAGVDMQKGQ
ncbi:MAG: Asp23/Gls24 family envelope stress response protein [Lachnospiraceae bacterium]|nr:Asp23/Gls24 family envelope stress response protein [Candidatus Colinaster scatohippi]